ncbi:cobalamin biosynthesis protein CbiM [filamentous cyanobacterium CCP2]|nr:cobalamin biosynthesis protein CbiM [filamentous cyanobacterium CCP2]
MVHIPDGILPASVCVGGYAVTGLATWYSLRQISRQKDPTQDIPKAALMTAAFFVASSVSIPIPPASVHFILNGLMGTVLGYYTFPAMLVGLFFQAVMIGHGGLTTLGVNAAMMGIPALLAYHFFRSRYRLFNHPNARWAISVFGFLAGAIGLGLAAGIFYVLVVITIPSGFDLATERAAITGLTLAHLPLMIIEGVFTAMLMLFLWRVKPDLLERRG